MSTSTTAAAVNTWLLAHPEVDITDPTLPMLISKDLRLPYTPIAMSLGQRRRHKPAQNAVRSWLDAHPEFDIHAFGSIKALREATGCSDKAVAPVLRELRAQKPVSKAVAVRKSPKKMVPAERISAALDSAPGNTLRGDQLASPERPPIDAILGEGFALTGYIVRDITGGQWELRPR